MSTIQVFTDTGSDMTNELIAQGIKIVPLYITFDGKESLKQMVDISLDDFYKEKNKNKNSLFKNFIKYRYNLDITFSNDNKFFVVDGFDFRDIDNVFKLKMEYPLIKKELNLNFDFIPYYEEFTRSPGLRKSISSNLDWLDIKKMSEEIKDDEILIKSLKIMIIKYIFDLNMKKIKNKSFDENELHILKLYKDLNIELYPFLCKYPGRH